MQSILILVEVIGIAYFLFSRRKFDFFILGFFSSCVYFLPGILGYTVYCRKSDETELIILEKATLVNGTYHIMIAVLISILIGAVIFDFITIENKLEEKSNTHISSIDNCGYIAAVISVISLFLLIITAGKGLFNINKEIMLDSLNRWAVAYTVTASIGAVILYTQKKWKWFFVCMIVMTFDLYIGVRINFIITLLSIITIEFSRKGYVRFAFKNFKLIILALFMGMFAFFYKSLYVLIRAGYWDKVWEGLSSSKFYMDTVVSSEPFITQSILNRVVESSFTVPMSHFKSVLYQFILFAPQLGAKDTSFNSLFQPALFPGLHDGMLANNIWAEMISSGGWLLLLNFIVLYVVILFVGSYFLKCENPVIKGGIVLIMTYWAFYIHRNDISYQINVEKRIVLFWLICIIISVIISKIGIMLKMKRR